MNFSDFLGHTFSDDKLEVKQFRDQAAVSATIDTIGLEHSSDKSVTVPS